MTMPTFAAKLVDKEGSISKILHFIDKQPYYPIGMKGENYSIDNPEQKVFIEQRYYDIKFNLTINVDVKFNTSNVSLTGFEKREIEPE